MSDEDELLEMSMKVFEKLRDSKTARLSNYLQILPDEYVQGAARQLLRQYFKQRTETEPLSAQVKETMSTAICLQVINESVQKARCSETNQVDTDRDGAELFYRRALKHMAMERFSEAERTLRRSVEICPAFADGWEAFAEVLEHNGKLQLAEQARLRHRELKNKL